MTLPEIGKLHYETHDVHPHSDNPDKIQYAVERGESGSQNLGPQNGLRQPLARTSVSNVPLSSANDEASNNEKLNGEYGPQGGLETVQEVVRQRHRDRERLRSSAREMDNNDITEGLNFDAGSEDHQKYGAHPTRKLSSSKLWELTSSPDFLPKRNSMSDPEESTLHASGPTATLQMNGESQGYASGNTGQEHLGDHDQYHAENPKISPIPSDDQALACGPPASKGHLNPSRHHMASRTFSTPPLRRRTSSKGLSSGKASTHRSTKNFRLSPKSLTAHAMGPGLQNDMMEASIPSPMPSTIPAPPSSLSTFLELELSSRPPPPFYIHQSKFNDYPYESSHVKLERLQNFLLLPPQLEQVLWFGALACLDVWLYTFTLLPLRFMKALSLLVQSWAINIASESKLVATFVYTGSGRFWRRRRKSSLPESDRTLTPSNDGVSQKLEKARMGPPFPSENGNITHEQRQPTQSHRNSNTHRHHRRTKSTPSALSENHKADILKGLLIVISCIILMHFDASRMYHGIRGQAAIKLYVIYNVLEVCDRLFSAIGQDVLECLFSKEALERKPDGRSKVLRPFWLFVLALLYNLVHSTALFYQVITLNVAVNSYSNALLTLLMSNQFVEIKSTVFKKFEKENLFQLTCADVVERFQLWLMLTIIAARNIIETGGLSPNGSIEPVPAAPLQSSFLSKSFTLLPAWTGMIMGPFLLVLGSEMLVDWVKHAYITKFNLTRPAVYGRFLDILAKDYYTNAFADQNLTRRLGLPVIPLSCLFIRASVQTYQMFLATHMPIPIPSTATSLSVDEATTSPATTAALQHIDHIFRNALGRSTFGGGGGGSPTLVTAPSSWFTTDNLIALTTMILFFLVLFLLLLALKLVLGMCLLSFARRRYIGMKQRERDNSVDAEGKRVGGWGVVEVDEAKRSWIYADDSEGLEKLRERERKKGREDDDIFSGVTRYRMVAKRIW